MGDPYKEDSHTLGSILGSPNFGGLPHEVGKNMEKPIGFGVVGVGWVHRNCAEASGCSGGS